jgi:hypothetical protein
MKLKSRYICMMSTAAVLAIAALHMELHRLTPDDTPGERRYAKC